VLQQRECLRLWGEQVHVLVAREDQLLVTQPQVGSVLSEEVTLCKVLAFLEFALLAGCCLIVQDPLHWALIEATEKHNLVLIDLESTKVEAGHGQLNIEQLPVVLALAEPLNPLGRHELVGGSLIEPTETVECASIVEEAQAHRELSLTQLRQSLPLVVGHNVALALLGGFVGISFASSDKDLREIWVNSTSESRTVDPHRRTLLELTVDDLEGLV
jgi:hypothetical protein